MSRSEQVIYGELQEAKWALEKALKDIKRLDGELGGTSTLDSEVQPIIDEVFGEE